MSKRLGEALIERGRITAEHLELALRNQLMLGGHLGTCLIELGYADEDTVGLALSDLLKVPYASRAILTGIPAATIGILPKKIVEECQAIPFGAQDKTLGVAMVEPLNLRLLDEVRFASGMRVVPWVSPEVRVVEAMETYYDIPRRTRYIAICRAMENPSKDREAGGAPSSGPAKRLPVAPELHPSGAAFVDPGAEYGYGRSWVEVAEELAARESEFVARRDARAHPPAGPASHLNDLAERLCLAGDKDAIARDVLDFAANGLARAALLSVRDDEVHVWAAYGFDASDSIVVPFRIATSGIFDHLLGQDHYRGASGRDPAERRFFAWLGLEPPAEIVLVPVYLSDRLVAFFYGDGGPDGSVEGTTEDYRRVGRMVGLALNTVILKKKIRAAGTSADSRIPR